MNRMVLRSLLISMVLSALGLAWVLFRVGGAQDLWVVRRLSLPFGVATLLGLACFLALNALRLQFMCARLGQRVPFVQALRAHLVGMFSATVTPGGAGATPAIALALQASRMPATNAWAVGVAVFGADALFHAWGLPIALAILYAMQAFPHTPLYLSLGAITVVLAGAIAYLVQFRLAWIEPIARTLLRGPLIRWRRRGLRFVETMLESHNVFSNAPAQFYVMLQGITAASWISFFSILYFLARGVGLPASLLEIEAAQMVLSVVSVFVPTPGGSGFFELGVSYVLLNRGGQASVPAVVLMWRLVTFYSIFLVGPLFGGSLLARVLPSADTQAG